MLSKNRSVLATSDAPCPILNAPSEIIELIVSYVWLHGNWTNRSINPLSQTCKKLRRHVLPKLFYSQSFELRTPDGSARLGSNCDNIEVLCECDCEGLQFVRQLDIRLPWQYCRPQTWRSKGWGQAISGLLRRMVSLRFVRYVCVLSDAQKIYG